MSRKPAKVKASDEAFRREYHRLALLYQVSNVIHSTLEPHQALRLILAEAVRVMRASSGSVVLVNPTNGFLEIQASHGLPEKGASLKLRVGEGITGWVAKSGLPARIGNVASDPRYIMVNERVRSELAVPLDVNGETRGVINVDSERADAFSADDEQLLRDLAMQASRVIQNTWLYEQVRLKAQLLESLLKVGQTINSTLNLEEALKEITSQACTLMSAKMSSLLMLDSTGDWLDLRASHGAGPAYISKPRLSVSESLLGSVLRRHKPIQVENVQVSSRYQSLEVARREGLVSLLSVPLVFHGKAMGTLSVYTGALHSFSNEEIRILSALAEMSGIAIEKARLYERIVDIEEELRQNEKLSALGLLAAEVAHEIRNPLTVMKMLYHSLDLKFPEGDPRNRDAAVMGEKMNHLNKIVEQILNFARTAEPNLAAINLNKLVDDMMLLTRHKLSQQNIQFVRKLDLDLPLVLADSTQLEQALLNLTLNAAEAMPTGGCLTISTRFLKCRDEEGIGQIVLEVKDTGEGMSEEQQQHAFTSLLSTTKKTGTGLGLAIVNKIVETHNGSIKVRSRAGKGTLIELRLPALAPGAKSK